jgi:hypothetical protein
LGQPAVPAADPAAALILAGADDPSIPQVHAGLMARPLPNTRRYLYPDGHLGLLTMADKLAPMTAGFLAQTRPHRPRPAGHAPC